MKNQKGGFIRVGFSNSAPDVLRVHVEDNGPGLSNEARRPGAMGLYLSGTRASTYNHLFNMNIQTFFLNKKDKTAEEHGTIVELLIPYIKHEKTRI